MRIEPVFLFDLDGTLVDSVYQHIPVFVEASNVAPQIAAGMIVNLTSVRL
jgi:beta-phosphoglucomutase-like phosphatase (HAD superfamily)